MERLDASEVSCQSQEGSRTKDDGLKVEKDANNIPFKKPISNEKNSKMEMVLELKHEVWKLTKVCLK
jgi:hypothetical protein